MRKIMGRIGDKFDFYRQERKNFDCLLTAGDRRLKSQRN